MVEVKSSLSQTSKQTDQATEPPTDKQTRSRLEFTKAKRAQCPTDQESPKSKRTRPEPVKSCEEPVCRDNNFDLSTCTDSCDLEDNIMIRADFLSVI